MNCLSVYGKATRGLLVGLDAKNLITPRIGDVTNLIVAIVPLGIKLEIVHIKTVSKTL